MDQGKARHMLSEPERGEVIFWSHKTRGIKDFQKESGPQVPSESHFNASPSISEFFDTEFEEGLGLDHLPTKAVCCAPSQRHLVLPRLRRGFRAAI